MEFLLRRPQRPTDCLIHFPADTRYTGENIKIIREIWDSGGVKTGESVMNAGESKEALLPGLIDGLQGFSSVFIGNSSGIHQ